MIDCLTIITTSILDCIVGLLIGHKLDKKASGHHRIRALTL